VAVARHGKPVSFWGLDGKQLSQLSGNEEWSSVCFSPDGRRLATVGTAATASVWRTEHLSRPGFEPSLISELKGHTDAINNVSFSPDGQRLVSSCRDQDFRLYDVESGYELIKLQSGRGTDGEIHFSPDGKLIVRTLAGIFSTWSNEDLSALQPAFSGQTSDFAWHQAEATAAEKASDWFAARFHQDYLAKLEPDNVSHFLSSANACLQLGDFKGAEVRFCQCVGRVEESAELGLLYGLCKTYLVQQKQAEYREVCQRLLNRVANSTVPLELNDSLWFASLDPYSNYDTSNIKLKLEALLADPKNRKAAYYNTLAMHHYRHQEYRDAIRCANESLKLLKGQPSPHDWMILALCYAQLDQQQWGWLPLFIRQKLRQWKLSYRWNTSLNYLVPVDDWMKEMEAKINDSKPIARNDMLTLRIDLPSLKREWEEIANGSAGLVPAVSKTERLDIE
jgi:hypothetical protein